MEKGRAFLGKGWVFILGVLLLTLSCGGMNQAPFGSKMSMPADTTVASAVDVVFVAKVVVVDQDGNPLNDVDVDFTVCCDGGEFVDNNGGSLGTDITIRTDGIGVATANVLVYGNYAGDVNIFATIGTVSDTTKITKTVPAS
ncbi:MAG: hypothetical protein PHE84_02230 [bacterium]|nr:hypothetical protein [bacterium]